MAEAGRSVEDRLREEYFALLPEVRRVAQQIEAETRYYLRTISRKLETYEQVVVRSRIEECESAVDALRRRQEGATFQQDRPELYTMTALNDLAGVRVLVFPGSRLPQVDEAFAQPLAFYVLDFRSNRGQRRTVQTRTFAQGHK